jgi:hypothetical protein
MNRCSVFNAWDLKWNRFYGMNWPLARAYFLW